MLALTRKPLVRRSEGTRGSGSVRGGTTVTLPDEYVCDLCGCFFLSPVAKDIFCPNCGSSQVKKEIGCNELSDEDVYFEILQDSEKGNLFW
jgi:hypothetical protein